MQALEKLSRDHPQAVLRAGALTAALAYIDFFATPVQRTSANIAANICKRIPSDCVPMVLDAVGNITALINSQDSKSMLLCFGYVLLFLPALTDP